MMKLDGVSVKGSALSIDPPVIGKRTYFVKLGGLKAVFREFEHNELFGKRSSLLR
jgi:hypothetical protein